MNKILEQVVDSIHGFFARLGVDRWLAKMNIDSTEVVRDGLGFIMGMIFGFTCKKYCKIMLITVGVTIAVIKGLEYQNLLTLDYAGFKTFIGVDSAATFSSFGSDALTWIKENMVATTCTALGFLIGFKLG